MSSLSSSLSFSSIASSSSTISLSISYGDENRQMWFPTSMTWNDVRSSILSCYLLSGMASDYRFSYTDEEGDDIAIEHDSEFIEAKRSAASKGSYLQLSLVRVAQNGAPLSSNGRSKDDFASLEDNSDLEESYVSVNDISKTPTNQSIVVIEEKKPDNVPMVADANNEKKDENIIDDALSALQQEAEQQQIKMPVNEAEEKASPPSVSDPIILPPVVEQESSVSSVANDSAPIESKKSQNIDAALGAISSLLATSDAQEGLAKAVTSSLIDYSISIASPSDADLIRSNKSLLEERVNDGVNGRINTGLLARLLIRRLFSPKKTKTPTKRKKSLKSQPSNEEQKPVIAPSSSASLSSSSSSSSSGRAVHLGVSCDVCSIGPIVGARYHCITCDENDEIRKRGGWDCCEECETKTNHCTTGPVRHVLIKMKTPAKIVVEKEQPSQQWIESGQPLIYDAYAHFGDESIPVGVVNDRSVGEPQKAEKKRGKKYAKKMIKMLLQQFSDESLTCSSDSSSDDESAEKRKLTKKMEKQKKKAEKALRKAEKLKMKAEKKAAKGAEKSEAKIDEEKKENAVEKNDVIEKKEENKDEAKENEQEQQQALNPPSNAPENESSIQVESAAAAASPPQNISNNSEAVIKTEPSSSSSSASSSFLSFFPCVDSSQSIEQKADISLPVALPVPLPVAQPVISVPPPPPASSLPSILPAPFFPPPPSSLPPFNPFTFPPVPGSSIPSSTVAPSPPSPPLFFAYPDQLAQLTAMGFPRERSMELLNYYSGDLRKALNRLL